MTKMTPRRRAVLGLVIRSYIANAFPVGSKAFVAGYGLDVSPATIRNEMAALEEMGYLTHPHTSAGRVPTEQGYRFFVEHLVGETELPLAEKYKIRHQFHQTRLELEQWVRLAAAVLAHSTRKAAVATAPRVLHSKYKHLELISLNDYTALLVLVFLGGTVNQRMLSLDEVTDQDTLSRLSNELNSRFYGQAAAEIEAGLEGSGGLAEQVSSIVAEIMSTADLAASDQVYREGLSHILGEPEFAEGKPMRQMVEVLEGSSLLDMITTAALPLEVGGVQVLIGGEGRWHELTEMSLVLARYGLAGSATGLLGVVGPIRMPYDRTIGAVRYVSELMTSLVSEWYGVRSSDERE
jgi:heat-inducible transcriptional repressor